LAAGFCPKNLAFARKIMAFPESGGCSSPTAWLVCLCWTLPVCSCTDASTTKLLIRYLSNHCTPISDTVSTSACVGPAVIKSPFHATGSARTAVALFLLLVRRSGTHYPMTCEIRSVLWTVIDSRWRHFYFRGVPVCSAHCYLPPDTSEHTQPTEADLPTPTPGRMEGWVDLGGCVKTTLITARQRHRTKNTDFRSGIIRGTRSKCLQPYHNAFRRGSKTRNI